MMRLDGFFDRRLLVFNFLPSLTLHRSRWSDFCLSPQVMEGIAQAGDSARWHRHWSRHILASLDLHDRPAINLDDPALPLAVQPTALLTACARRVGVVLCARRLRHAIARDQVAALETALGKNVFALSHPGRGYPSVDDDGPAFASPGEAVATADAVGAEVLRAALKTSGELIWRRAELKMPCGIGASLLNGPAALDLALRVLSGVHEP
jgi:type III secretion protein K